MYVLWYPLHSASLGKMSYRPNYGFLALAALVRSILCTVSNYLCVSQYVPLYSGISGFTRDSDAIMASFHLLSMTRRDHIHS